MYLLMFGTLLVE